MARVLQGNIRFGLSPSSLSTIPDIFALVVSSTMESVAVPVTPDTVDQQWRRGARSGTLQIVYGDEASGSLDELAWTAQRSDSTTGGRRPGELYFAATVYGATVSVDNPEYRGWVLPEQVTVGGRSWTSGEHSVTWRISRGLERVT